MAAPLIVEYDSVGDILYLEAVSKPWASAQRLIGSAGTR